MSDLLTAVLLEWSDLVRQRAVLTALYACLGQRGDDGSCDTAFVTTHALVAVTRAPLRALPPAQALEALASDMADALTRRMRLGLSQRRHALLVAAARAAFLVLFLLDGRVRRFVATPDTTCHATMRTVAPPRPRVMAWLAAGAPAVARRYAEDVCAVAAADDDDDAMDVDDSGDGPAKRVADLTEDFVLFMQHWWLTGLDVLETTDRAQVQTMRDAGGREAWEALVADEDRRHAALVAAANPTGPSPDAWDWVHDQA